MKGMLRQAELPLSLTDRRHWDAGPSCCEHVICCVLFPFPLYIADRCVFMDVGAHGHQAGITFPVTVSAQKDPLQFGAALCSDLLPSECPLLCSAFEYAPLHPQVSLWRTEGNPLPQEGEFNWPSLIHALSLS